MIGEIARTAAQYVVIKHDGRPVRIPWEYCRFDMNEVGHGTKVTFDLVEKGNGSQIRNVKKATK